MAWTLASDQGVVAGAGVTDFYYPAMMDWNNGPYSGDKRLFIAFGTPSTNTAFNRMYVTKV